MKLFDRHKDLYSNDDDNDNAVLLRRSQSGEVVAAPVAPVQDSSLSPPKIVGLVSGLSSLFCFGVATIAFYNASQIDKPAQFHHFFAAIAEVCVATALVITALVCCLHPCRYLNNQEESDAPAAIEAPREVGERSPLLASNFMNYGS